MTAMPADSTVWCLYFSLYSPCVIPRFISAAESVLQVPVWCNPRQQWGANFYVVGNCKSLYSLSKAVRHVGHVDMLKWECSTLSTGHVCEFVVLKQGEKGDER